MINCDSALCTENRGTTACGSQLQSFFTAEDVVVANLAYNIDPEHITDALHSLQWLRVPERILFKLAVLTYRAVNCSAPEYLSSYFTRVANVPYCGFDHLIPTNLWCHPTI